MSYNIDIKNDIIKSLLKLKFFKQYYENLQLHNIKYHTITE